MDRTPTRRTRRPITDLHRATFDALLPLVNRFDPGVKVLGSPVHAIPREYWSLNRRAKRGEKDLTYRGEPWGRSAIARNVFSVYHVRDHIEGRDQHYFTGGKGGRTVFMLDLDEHEPWQKGLARPAWDVLAAAWRAYFGADPYHRDSPGGYHGYPVLAYPLNCLDPDTSYEAVNTAYARLQHATGLLLLSRGNYSTFEVKGTITTKAKSGSLAKLPLCTWLPYLRRDSWNFEHLRRFEGQRVITLDELNGFIDHLADLVAEQPQLIDHHRGIRAGLKERYRRQESSIQATVQPAAGDGAVEVVRTAPVAVQAIPAVGHRPTERVRPIKLRKLGLDAENPDSRQREHRVLMAAARQLGRVPTVREALDLLAQPDHYWNEKRRKRLAGTLRFISKGFDPSMCKGCGRKPALGLDRYTQTFAHRYRHLKIDPGKLSAFVVALEWSLGHQDRGDGSVPRSRILKLSGLGNEAYRKLARFVVREGVFECDLSDYRQDQARRWKVGDQFPGREWWRKQNCTPLPPVRRGGVELRRGKFVAVPRRPAPVNLPGSGFVVGKDARTTGTPHTHYHNPLVSKRTACLPPERRHRGRPGRGPPQEEVRKPERMPGRPREPRADEDSHSPGRYGPRRAVCDRTSGGSDGRADHRHVAIFAEASRRGLLTSVAEAVAKGGLQCGAGKEESHLLGGAGGCLGDR